MSAEQLVSVIIPTYNRASKCVEAVQSVLAQTHRQVEVLVIDDGSTDDTESRLSAMDGRIRYLRQENAGVSAARNRGLVEARGAYVAFLDSDDRWMPWKLEAQLNILTQFPEAGMVWTDMTAVDEDGNVVSDTYLTTMYHAYRYFDPDRDWRASARLGDLWPRCPTDLAGCRVYFGEIFSQMFLGNLVHTSTVLLTRQRQQSISGFDETLVKTGEDYDYHLRTCEKGPVAMLAAPSIYYQVGGEDQLTAPGLEKTMAQNNLRTIRKAWAAHREELRLSKEQVKHRWARAYWWVARETIMEDPREARRQIVNSLHWRLWQPRVLVFAFLSLLPVKVLCWLREVKRILGLIFPEAGGGPL